MQSYNRPSYIRNNYKVKLPVTRDDCMSRRTAAYYISGIRVGDSINRTSDSTVNNALFGVRD